MENTLSVCLIVKNEEKNLDRCLRSIYHIADEIIVVDTGSEDKTVRIAKSYGAKVIEHPWKNDFSDARNKSIENATKNWILFLDADEEMPYEDGKNLKLILQQNAQFEAFHLRLVNIISGINTGDSIVLRVFKNDPRYRFRGKMHEQIVTCIEEIHSSSVLGATDVKILHYGYDPDLCDINKKQKRNLELLNSYSEDQKDGYYYYSLGNEYARIDDFDNALKIYEKALNAPYPAGTTPIYIPYLFLNYAKVYFNSCRYMDLIDCINTFTKTHSNFKDLYFYGFLGYSQAGFFKEAKSSLQKYINCPSGNYEYPCSKFEDQYNLDELMANLNNSIVDHPENLLSALILLDSDNSKVTESIKCLNEIFDEVYVMCSSSVNLSKAPIENLGAKVIEVDSNSKEEIFMTGLKECNGKYVLLLKENEYLQFAFQRNFVEFLLNNKNSYFNLPVSNSKTNQSSIELRLLKNDSNLKEHVDFNSLANFVHSNKVEYCPVILQKILFD